MTRSIKDKVLDTLWQLKQAVGCAAMHLPVVQHGQTVARLEPVTWQDATRPEAVKLLAAWREAANPFFPAQFPVTLAGTQRWVVKQLLEVPDRLLFWVKGNDGTAVGHVGLFRFDWDARSVEIDNIVRGMQGALPGIIHASVQTLLQWTYEALHMDEVFLRVLSDNERAVKLYARCGFRETMRVPLARQQEGDVVHWVEVNSEYRQPVSRYFVTMRLTRAEWQALCGTHRAAA
jgi:RimJ/RimL family protein N-acetyltransferase